MSWRTVTLPDHAPVAAVLDALVTALGLASIKGIAALKDKWAASLEDHLITSLGSIRRLSPQRLSRLGLPVLIEDELEKIIVAFETREPLVHVQGVARHDGDARMHSSTGGRAASRVTVVTAARSSGSTTPPQAVATEPKANPLAAVAPRQRDLIKATWQTLLTMKDFENAQNDGLYQLAKTFYPNFLKVNYTARRLFAEHDLQKQGSALVRMIAFMVKGLDDPDSVVRPMRELGGRHVVYGVERQDFLQFAKSFVETLQQILGKERLDAEAQRAWFDVLHAMTELLLDAGATARAGFHGVLLKEGTGGQWKKLYAHLTLDTLFLYADAKLKKLKGRYPMSNVDEIAFPSSLQANAFKLVCPVTPFTLLVAAESKAALDEWITEVTWRLAALNRVYSESVDSDTDGEASASGGDGSASLSSKRVMKKAKRTTKQLQKKREQVEAGGEGNGGGTNGASSGAGGSGKSAATALQLKINVTTEQARLLKASWDALVNLRDPADPSQNGLNRFVDQFYPNFFAINPTANRLFKGTSMKVQGRALIKMIGVILRGLDDPKSVQETLLALGGRHEIYGVEAFDYQQFAICLADTLEAVLGGKVVTDGVRDAWFKTIVALSQVMLAAGRQLTTQQFRSSMLRLKSNGKWKKGVAGLSLRQLNLYDDDEGLKLKTSYDLRNMLDVVVEEDMEAPTDFVFSVTMTDAPFKVTLGADTEDLFLKWIGAWPLLSAPLLAYPLFL